MNREKLEKFKRRHESSKAHKWLMSRIESRESQEAPKREERRIVPFENLAVANREVVKRARRIIGLVQHVKGKDKCTYQSPWIILDKPEREGGNWAIGYVSLDHSDTAYYVRPTFNILATSDEKIIRRLQAAPASGEHFPGEIYQERTYGISNNADEITFTVSRIVKGGPVDPLGALDRFMRSRKFAKGVGNLQETVTLFEQAICDPELNPHLARAVSGAQFQPHQQAA